jgi:hypothetical protein
VVNHPNRGKKSQDELVTMPKEELLERLRFAGIIFAAADKIGLSPEEFVTMPMEELRERAVIKDYSRGPREGVNYGEPKANASVEDQVYAVLYGRNFQHPDWHLDLEGLLETEFAGYDLSGAVDRMICNHVGGAIGVKLGWTPEQTNALAERMSGGFHISECLTFDDEHGVHCSDELVEAIEKTAIEAAHDATTA